MAYNLTVNGTSYPLPSPGDTAAWAANINAFFTALAQYTFQPSGGTFALTSDVNFGASKGLLSAYFTSRTASAAASGAVRLANLDFVKWRNAANAADLYLGTSSRDQLAFGGTDITGNPQAIYTTAAAQAVTTGSTAIINFGTSERDSATAVTVGAAWKFTVPAGKDGLYVISAAVTPNAAVASGNTILAVYKNGSEVRRIYRSAGAIPSTNMLMGSTSLYLAAADYIDVRLAQSSGGTVTLTAVATENHISITRVVT